MGQQSVRQAARRAVLDARTIRRREQAEREQRVEVLVVELLVAVRERDTAVTATEARAGRALQQLLTAEGLTVREVLRWCGDACGLTGREVARLRAARTATADAMNGTDVPAVVPAVSALVAPDHPAAQQSAAPGAAAQ